MQKPSNPLSPPCIPPFFGFRDPSARSNFMAIQEMIPVIQFDCLSFTSLLQKPGIPLIEFSSKRVKTHTHSNKKESTLRQH